MAYTTIKKPSDYFSNTLYTGNNTAGRSITGVGFQPDLVWNKNRTGDGNHHLYDSVRGTQKFVRTNLTATQGTNGGTDGLTAFGTDGYTIGDNSGINYNGRTYVSWNFKANGAGSSNTDGSISSTVSANTTSRFSIVKFTGTGSAGTVGHGLGATPAMVMVKNASVEQSWRVWNKNLNSNQNIILNTDAAATVNTGQFNSSATFNSNVFSVGGENGTNGSGETMIAYCFSDVQGYSKFGSYTGNGSTNGTFIYTGFKPSFVMFKNTSSALFWQIHDSARDPFNEVQKRLAPNTSDAEGSGSVPIDFLSNGIKLRTTATTWNESGSNFIYMAFAEAPLVGTNNVPCTAR